MSYSDWTTPHARLQPSSYDQGLMLPPGFNELSPFEQDKIRQDEIFYRTFPAARFAKYYGHLQPPLDTSVFISTPQPSSSSSAQDAPQHFRTLNWRAQEDIGQYKSYTLLSALAPTSCEDNALMAASSSTIASQGDSFQNQLASAFTSSPLSPTADAHHYAHDSPTDSGLDMSILPSPVSSTTTPPKRTSKKLKARQRADTTESSSSDAGPSSITSEQAENRVQFLSTSASSDGEIEKEKPRLACYFCRGRKIACGPPDPDSGSHTCNQCARRNLPCTFPQESRRGVRARVPKDPSQKKEKREKKDPKSKKGKGKITTAADIDTEADVDVEMSYDSN